MKRFSHRLVSLAAVGMIGGAAWIVGHASTSRAEDKASGHSIKEIMKIGMKGDEKNKIDPLCKVVTGPKTSKQSVDDLVKLCKELAAAKPPKGDAAIWKSKTEALLAATEELGKTEKPTAAAIATFKKAIDCKGCHTGFKPAKK